MALHDFRVSNMERCSLEYMYISCLWINATLKILPSLRLPHRLSLRLVEVQTEYVVAVTIGISD